MNQLNSFLELIKNSSKIKEFDDRVEGTFEAADLKLPEMNFDGWLKKEVLGLQIESDWANTWDEIKAARDEERCFINLRKEDFIENVIKADVDSNQFVFFSIDYLKKWLSVHTSPFSAAHPLYKEGKQNILWVNGLQSEFTGSCLSVFPLGSQPEQFFYPMDASLPGNEEIRSHVHFVSRDAVTIVPEAFRLPDAAFNERELKPFFLSYVKLLAACLVKEFYSEESIIISGLKRISLLLADTNTYDISLDDIAALENAVRWVYAEKTETRLLLLMDRVSLDLPEGGDMIPSIFGKINQALEQAKYRYEFVIKDRQEAHAKELADLQKDVKTATEGYSAAVNTIVTGLLKDGLSSVFVIGITVLSRIIGQNNFLKSTQCHYLFKGLAVYLVISLFVRLTTNNTRLSLALKDIEYWKDTTRNHMSTNEVEQHISSRTEPYKKFYKTWAMITVVIYIVLFFLVWNLPDLMAKTPVVTPAVIHDVILAGLVK